MFGVEHGTVENKKRMRMRTTVYAKT